MYQLGHCCAHRNQPLLLLTKSSSVRMHTLTFQFQLECGDDIIMTEEVQASDSSSLFEPSSEEDGEDPPNSLYCTPVNRDLASAKSRRRPRHLLPDPILTQSMPKKGSLRYNSSLLLFYHFFIFLCVCSSDKRKGETPKNVRNKRYEAAAMQCANMDA